MNARLAMRFPTSGVLSTHHIGFLATRPSYKSTRISDALRYLRKPDAERVLWIDRIAINQEDLKERAAQVGLMSEIYSSASEVPVWLGRADGATSKSFSTLMILLGRFSHFGILRALKSPRAVI